MHLVHPLNTVWFDCDI